MLSASKILLSTNWLFWDLFPKYVVVRVSNTWLLRFGTSADGISSWGSQYGAMVYVACRCSWSAVVVVLVIVIMVFFARFNHKLQMFARGYNYCKFLQNLEIITV